VLLMVATLHRARQCVLEPARVSMVSADLILPSPAFPVAQ
jgi:hypothetical protein